MKKFLLPLLVFALTISGGAFGQQQDAWLLKLNKNILLRTPLEKNEPVIYLSKSALQERKVFTIQYTTANAQSDWKRFFRFNDDAGNDVKEVQMKNHSGSVSFYLKDLRAAAAANKPLYIYTYSLPKDPLLAERVRVQSFLLCKIQWKK